MNNLKIFGKEYPILEVKDDVYALIEYENEKVYCHSLIELIDKGDILDYYGVNFCISGATISTRRINNTNTLTIELRKLTQTFYRHCEPQDLPTTYMYNKRRIYNAKKILE